MESEPQLSLRSARPTDLSLLLHWQEQPHIIAAGITEDWQWETELQRNPPWREQLIAEVAGRPIGFVQIIDPGLEETHYWGDISENLRAIDLWIGSAADLGQGWGTQMMNIALCKCFAPEDVLGVLVDPLASNQRAHRFYQRFGFQPIAHQWLGSDYCLIHRLERLTWEKNEELG